MLNASDLFKLPPAARREKILATVKTSSLIDELNAALAYSRAINSFISDYFELRIKRDLSRPEGSILLPENLKREISKEIDKFRPIAIAKLHQSAPGKETLISDPANLYQLAGAVTLSSANRVTRNLSTTMGSLWERIAAISPYAISPELEFNIAIKGIDLISKNSKTKEIEYQQLKTQRNTLTGSQRSRSVLELKIHDNPVFCACFSLGAWTFRDENIPRVSGEEFWERIGINYSTFVSCVTSLIAELEEEFSSLHT